MSWTLVASLVQTIVSIAGLAALIWSVLLLVKQTREMARQSELVARATRSSVYQGVIELTMEMNRLWLEHPDLKPYFFSNMEVAEDHPDYPRITTIADMLLDLMDDVFVQSNNMPEYDWTSWKLAFQNIFASSPILRRYYMERRESYPMNLRSFLETR